MSTSFYKGGGGGMMNRFIRFKNKLLIMRKTYLQLNDHYPKDTYERQARKEMNALLLDFNTTYYSFFPHLIVEEKKLVVDTYPKRHSKQYEVERVLELCKIQKVRRKDMVEIEKLLNLKYIIETQVDFYNWHLDNVKKAEDALENELFESFFPLLFEERKVDLHNMQVYYNEMMGKLQEENGQCERRIEALLRRGPGFLGEAGQFINEVMTESMRKVKHTFKRKL